MSPPSCLFEPRKSRYSCNQTGTFSRPLEWDAFTLVPDECVAAKFDWWRGSRRIVNYQKCGKALLGT